MVASYSACHQQDGAHDTHRDTCEQVFMSHGRRGGRGEGFDLWDEFVIYEEARSQRSDEHPNLEQGRPTATFQGPMFQFPQHPPGSGGGNEPNKELNHKTGRHG